MSPLKRWWNLLRLDTALRPEVLEPSRKLFWKTVNGEVWEASQPHRYDTCPVCGLPFDQCEYFQRLEEDDA